MFFQNDPTQNNTEWYVSEESRARLGKGIIGQIRYSPDGTQLAVGSSIGIWIYNAHTGKELNLLTGHTKWPGCIAYSPDGNTLASGGKLDTGTVCLWDPNTGEHKATLGEHERFVTCLEFSPDGSILASSSVDQTIQLWDVAIGKHKATLKGHTGGKELMAFSPDGRTLASAPDKLWGNRDDKTIQLWDVRTGKRRVTFENINSCVFKSIVFSPDGNLIASGGWDIHHSDSSFRSSWVDGTVQLWDVSTGERKVELMGHTDAVFTVAYSPDGLSFISGSRDGTILLWDAATYQLKAKLTGYLDAITFSPDSKTLAIGNQDKEIKLWDAVSGEHKTTLTEHTDNVGNLIFNPDGRTFAGIGGDSTIRLWDAVTGEHLKTITGHTRSISSISFNADGSKLATGSGHDDGTSGDKIIRIWNVHSGCLQNTFKVPIGRWVRQLIDYVSYSPDGKTLATGSEDGTIRLWDAESGKLQFTTFEGLTDSAANLGYCEGLLLAYSPDGKTFVSRSEISWDSFIDGTIQLWDAVTCKHKVSLTTGYRGPGGAVISLAFSPDSRTVAGGDNDGTVYLWDAVTGELKATLLGHVKYVFSIAFSPDGRTLASGWKSVCLWDVASGECKATLDMHRGTVSSVAFSPDGSILAVASTNDVTLWDVCKILHQSHDNTPIHTYATNRYDVTGRHKTTLKGHIGFVSSVAFSPDGRILASGGEDGTILLWDITKTPQTPRQIAEYSLGSTVLVVKGRNVSRDWDPSYIMLITKPFQYATGNGFFVKRGLIATYTHLWAPPGYFRQRLFGKWINLIIQDVTTRSRVIKEANVSSLALCHHWRDNIRVEGIAAIDEQLAILKVSDSDVQPLSLSNDGVQIGDTVYVASNPSNFSQGVVRSIVTFRNRTFYQITASIPYGCNGSPVLNSKGQVIGVAMATRIDRQVQFAPFAQLLDNYDKQNPNYAIPAYYLRELLSKVEESN